jgi:uncharacterized protein YidB (DUF937 family)
VTRRKTGIIVGAAAAALLVVFGGGALAASSVFSPKQESQAIINDAAGQLGVEPSELSNALKQALKDRIDAAVAAGRLTEEQAAALKERIDSEDFPLLGAGAFHGFHGPGFGHVGQGAVLAAAASYLGLTEAQLREQLDGQTLADIAKKQGKSVAGLVKAMVTAAEREIDGAVADGKLTKEQADTIKANLEARIESLVNGESPHGVFGHHPGWSRSEAPRGPPFFDGPTA